MSRHLNVAESHSTRSRYAHDEQLSAAWAASLDRVSPEARAKAPLSVSRHRLTQELQELYLCGGIGAPDVMLRSLKRL